MGHNSELLIGREDLGVERAEGFFKQFRISGWINDPSQEEDLPIITPGNIFVVLNQRTGGMMTPDEWHRAADAACRKLGLGVGFPPVVAVIPYVPEVSVAQDNGRSALDANDEFARPILKLSDMLFGSAVGVPAARDDSSVLKFGPLKIRTKR